VKKKDSDSHLIKKISLVPFIKTKTGIKYLCKNQYESLKYYEFPSSSISYHDLPTLNNENVINITAFYVSFKDFVYDTTNNTIERILSEELEGKLQSNFTILSQFKPKVYEPFYNHTTGTLSILLQCNEEESFKVKGYEFQSIIGNPFEFDNILLERIGTLVDDSTRITQAFLDNPLNFNDQEITKCLANHEDIAGREKTKFYSEMIKKELPDSR
jgi:hypothetical protein